LARAGAKVYIAAQSQSNAEAAIASIQNLIGGKGTLEFLELKLQGISTAISAGQNFLARESRLDILVANAGIHSKNVLNSDGIEMVLAVNHVGHHAFITTVLPLMLSTSKTYNTATHIAVTSSHSHFDITSAGNFDDFATLFKTTTTPTSDKFMDFNIRYARSKVANNLFVKHLSSLLQTPEYAARGGNLVFVNTAHPGFIKTDIADSIGSVSAPWFGRVVGFVGSTLGISPAEGALTQLFLVTSPKVQGEGIRGRYFVPIAKEVKQSALVEEERARRLWEWTEGEIRRVMGEGKEI
jgi:NAD(P)-dependent dehydrogenase (short-subunit alcohol dehydrogenase family)